MSEEEMEIEVATYTVTSPDLLEAMIEVSELLEKVARGELTLQEARAIYAESLLPRLKEIEEKYRPKEKKKKEKKKVSKKKKEEKTRKEAKSKAKTTKSKKRKKASS